MSSDADQHAQDTMGRLERLHEGLIDHAETLLGKGEWALAMALCKHNGITAPRKASNGAMEGAAEIAKKISGQTFRPRTRPNVVPLKSSSG